MVSTSAVVAPYALAESSEPQRDSAVTVSCGYLVPVFRRLGTAPFRVVGTATVTEVELTIAARLEAGALRMVESSKRIRPAVLQRAIRLQCACNRPVAVWGDSWRSDRSGLLGRSHPNVGGPVSRQRCISRADLQMVPFRRDLTLTQALLNDGGSFINNERKTTAVPDIRNTGTNYLESRYHLPRIDTVTREESTRGRR